MAKRAELNLANLKMNKADISLFDIVKSTGEVKDTFKVTYDGRAYRQLSQSERVRAGLEISELIKRLAERNYPVFLDNGESIAVIDNMRPCGQFFISRVTGNAPLTVKAQNAQPLQKAS